MIRPARLTGGVLTSHNELSTFIDSGVPALRNIELTAPYFHNGNTETLEVAIEIMAEFQFGETLDPEQVRQIKAFLISLPGNVPKELR